MTSITTVRAMAAATGLALATTAGLLVAGPLSPPAGPVASSYKTLSEIEPRVAISAANTPGDAVSVYRITQPGSYYLTGNFTVPSGKTGIEVAAQNVSIDLGGFVISGAAGSLNGVASVTATFDNVRVRNGAVQGLGQHGVDLYTSHGGGIENVHARGCGGYGISSNMGGYLRSCTATACACARPPATSTRWPSRRTEPSGDGARTSMDNSAMARRRFRSRRG